MDELDETGPSSQMNFTPELDAELNNWLGSIELYSVGNDSDSQRVMNFLRHCCAAAVHSGLGEDGFGGKCTTAIDNAVEGFRGILSAHPWDSVSLINNLVVVLSTYGRHDMSIKILETLKIDAQKAVTGEESPHHFMSVLLIMLDFMSQIPADPMNEPNYDLTKLAVMVDSAKQCSQTGQHEQFVLSAKYVYAWALLEMRQPVKALLILNNLKDTCKQVSGFTQLQTINIMATLARAQAMVGEKTEAAETYRGFVVPRIRQFFPPTHPQFHDADYRHACYDRRCIDDLEDEQQKLVGRLDVARRIQVTLKWRQKFFGLDHPITVQNYRACLDVLKKLNRASDDTTLLEVPASGTLKVLPEIDLNRASERR